ncbi:MAG: aminotransferase class V-fold PLP-dependent enzyme [Terriglobia bacterium]
MLRFVAPAGAPLELAQILRSARASLVRSGAKDLLSTSFAAALNCRYVFTASSGRAALALILRSLARLRPGRNVVALPAYTCYTVPAAIVRAGLRIHPLEINPLTLDVASGQLDELPGEGLLSILTSNLFGLLNNTDRIRQAAQARGGFVIDDAAQALGATRNGCPAGTLGDVGFYSFGRGKALAAMEGAVIVTNSEEIASAIQRESSDTRPAPASHSVELFFQMLAYYVLLHPRLYWIPNSLPFLKLGTTEFDPSFPEFRMPGIVRELLPRLLERLAAMNGVRRANAAALGTGLKGHPEFTLLQPGEGVEPNYIRFPLLARDEATRERAVRLLRHAGIGAGPFYPGAVCDIPRIAAHAVPENFHRPAAEDTSHRLLTLPTHPYVGENDVRRMIDTLRKVEAR